MCFSPGQGASSCTWFQRFLPFVVQRILMKPESINVLPMDGEAILFKGLIKQSLELFTAFQKNIEWNQGTIQLYGKLLSEPRLTAWYGDEGAVYTYSGKINQPLPWTNDLIELRSFLENNGLGTYNSCLLNFYRDGKDSMGMHSDDEEELDTASGIASISLGGTRDFVFKHKTNDKTIKLKLESGDVLLMLGETQKHWKHGIPKRAKAGARINLTFRRVRTVA
jgi:alkylated DNA repair dioxygenase AlkB